MSEQKMPEALDAIRDLAVRLLNRKMPLEVSTGLRHIVKMARWKTALADPEDKIVYDEPHEDSDGLTYRILVFILRKPDITNLRTAFSRFPS